MESMISKYARLLVNYSLELKPKEKLYISTTLLAEPLVREIYRQATQLGAIVEVDFAFREQSRILLNEGNETVLSHAPTLHTQAMEEFDAYLNIRAPYNLNETSNANKDNRKIRSKALSHLNKLYFERTADKNASGSLKRTLCQYPTQASAQAANMSLEEYEHFVFNACHLYSDNPEGEWLRVRENQQKIKEYMDGVNTVRYKADHTDIEFSVAGRTWINSDGQTNMPSGEVFSGPVEDSVNGKVHFTFPSIYMGKDVQGITLWVENGEVVKWDANQGKDVLDHVFKVPGAKFFGEVAIGTNYNIQQATRNILFDEKIGGTIHMAVGQSYKQTGGTNTSTIHWDMITDMTESGEIYGDGKLIYEKGKFLI
jgi:aminopeptidase